MKVRFTGDYTAKTDVRGRVFFPAGLLKQLPEDYSGKFFIKTDVHEKYLNVFTEKEWNKQMEIVESRVNINNPQHAKFLRSYYKGVAEVSLDGSGRILLQKKIMEYAEIDKDVVFLGRLNKIEIWAKELYEQEGLSPEELANLSLELLGGDLSGL